MRFSKIFWERKKQKGAIRKSMERKQELQKITSKLDQEALLLINHLIDDLIFIEKQLEYLRTLPFISVSRKNPALQKSTPASKQYKELLQTYINALKVINSMLGIDSEKVESPLRDYMNARKNKLETR